MYVVQTNLWLQTTSKGTRSCTTMTTRHTSAIQLARDLVDAARGRWFLVSRLTIVIRHPTFIFQHMASRFNGSRSTTAFLPSSSVFRPPSSGFHLASLTSYRTVACYVFVCCCAFMFQFHSLDNSLFFTVYRCSSCFNINFIKLYALLSKLCNLSQSKNVTVCFNNLSNVCLQW